jgi:Protein of unknown function (DUF3795)
MESKQSRRRFLGDSAKMGGACCLLMGWNRNLSAGERLEITGSQETKPIDLKIFSYSGIPCLQACALSRATLKNDVKLKKLVYEKWQWKKKFGIEYDPEKVFCYTCKPGDKPLKVGMAACEVRNCGMANGVESCIQCGNLASCEKKYWKTWPEQHAAVKTLQARYKTQPGAVIKEIKAKP